MVFSQENKASSLFIIIIIALAWMANERNNIWRNEYTLWDDVTYKSPKKAMPHVNLGNAFVRRNLLDYAEGEFKAALNVNPKDIRAINGLAVIYVKEKNYAEAIRLLEILTSDKPNEAPFHNNLGVVYMERGLLDEAITSFNTAIKVNAAFPDPYNNLGVVYKKKGQIKEAKRAFEKALQLNPEHPNAERNLEELKKEMQ